MDLRKALVIPGTGDELYDGAEEEEGAVEGEAGGFPVRAQQAVQHLEPLHPRDEQTAVGLSNYYRAGLVAVDGTEEMDLPFRGGEGRGGEEKKRSSVADLDDVVLEVDVLLLLAGPVLDVEDADEVGGPAAHEAVEQLQQQPRQHPQLRERIRQRQQHLRHLHSQISPSPKTEQNNPFIHSFIHSCIDF